MKNSKKLKLILEILICVLIILVGIVGVYTKSSNMYKNLFPHTYTLASDIGGTTVIEFSPDDTKETVYYDKDGNEVDSSTVTDDNKKNYEEKEIPVNAEEKLNVSNYEKSLEIMQKRLELLNADQYNINVDEETGTILLKVEDDYLSDLESILPMEGRLYLQDSKTEDIILDYTDFKSAEASYASLTTEYRTYISFKLNEAGLEKVNNLEKYKITEQAEDGEEVEESSIIVMFDEDKVAEVSYDDILLNGKTFRITTASGLTSNSEINSQINIDTMSSKLATIGKMPVVYNISAEEFVKEDLKNVINYIVMVLIAICVVVSLILLFKYKLKGLLGILGFATNIALFLSVIRLTKIQISLNGLAGIIGLIVLNAILINNILKSIKNTEKTFWENIKIAYLKSLDAIVVMLIIFIVLALSSMTVINSAGLLMFWGWTAVVFGTLMFTVPMLSIATNK